MSRPRAPLEGDDMRVLWSVAQAAELLDPPATVDQVRALIALAGIVSVRKAEPHGRGRPPALYPAGELMRAHAGAVRAGLLKLLPPPIDAGDDEPADTPVDAPV